MKWIKHDTNASQDAKLKRMRMKYGLEGYGLYWYCLELIAADVDQHKLTFELEHDAEIIAFDTGIHYERVNEMMAYMVNLKLFEENNGVLSCLKLANRLDKSMTSNPMMRKMLEDVRNNHDKVMTQSAEPMQDKTRLDETREYKEVPAKAEKKLTKAELLVKKIRDNAESYPTINFINDDLLTEWAKLRTKKGASDSDRALKRIQETLNELKYTHGIDPVVAIGKQCDAGWTSLEVDYFVKGRQSTGQQVAVNNNQSFDDALKRVF
jgi:hypothetical protein